MGICDGRSVVCSSDLVWRYRARPDSEPARQFRGGLSVPRAVQPNAPDAQCRVGEAGRYLPARDDRGETARSGCADRAVARALWRLAAAAVDAGGPRGARRSEEHTSDLQSLMRRTDAAVSLIKNRHKRTT